MESKEISNPSAILTVLPRCSGWRRCGRTDIQTHGSEYEAAEIKRNGKRERERERE